MKSPIATLLALFFCSSCTFNTVARTETFEVCPSLIDVNLDRATIEDYITALPPEGFHEAPVESFRSTVRDARTSEPKNFGKDRDSLFISGDGCWPSQDFTLDRNTKTLRIRVNAWEPEEAPYEITMRRVPGGWMRGARRELTNAEQAGRGNGDKPTN